MVDSWVSCVLEVYFIRSVVVVARRIWLMEGVEYIFGKVLS